MPDSLVGKISVGDGATFTPSVTDGVISWTNNKNLPNPDPYDVAAKVLAEGENELRDLAAAAQTAAGNAATSETNAHNSELAAAGSATQAGAFATTATDKASEADKSADAAKASETAAKASETAAKASETAAKASETAAKASETAAKTSETNAKASETNAKASETAAKAYMDNAKNYSENVNVFLPSVSSAGVLSWTNRAGLDNPTSVNIKGAKGDTGAAATIRIGSVTTGAAGSNASVTNSGTTSDVVLNFTLPRGKDGTGGGGGTVTVDDELSDTSTNPVQNKVVKMNLDGLANGLGAVSNQIPTKVSALENDAGYLTQHQSLADYAKKNAANVWQAQQTFKKVVLEAENYASSWLRGTSDTPAISVMHYIATGAFTLNLTRIVAGLGVSKSTVFTAYIESSADYPLSITNAGTLKYIGAASDVAITSAGLLLNILLTKDANGPVGPVISIVQASKLS